MGGLKQADDAARGFAQRVQSGLGTLGKVAKGALLGVGAAAIAGFGMAVHSAIDMNASLETSQLQFTTLMGDADAAREHVANLFEFAGKTPFETGPIMEASRMLQTFGGVALNSMDNLTLIGDAAAATSAPINELGFWVGRLYSNLQGGQPFGEAAARLTELAVLTPEARREMEALQADGASAAEVFGVFQQSLGRFTGAMVTQAGTWSGLLSTLKDQLSLMAADALKPLFESLRSGLAAVVDALGSAEVQARIKEFAEGLARALDVVIPLAIEHGPKLLKVLTALGSILAGLMVTMKVSAAITGLKVALAGMSAASGAATAATGGLALALSPITVVVGLVVGAIMLLALAWKNNWLGIRDHTARAIEFIREVVSSGMAAVRRFWDEHGEAIMNVVRFVYEAIAGRIETFFANMRSLGEAFHALFTGDWRTAGEKLREIWDRTVGALVEGMVNLDRKLREGMTALAGKVRDWWNGIDWSTLGARAGEKLVDGIRSAWTRLEEADQRLRQGLTDLVMGFVEGGDAATETLYRQGEAAQVAATGYEALVEAEMREQLASFTAASNAGIVTEAYGGVAQAGLNVATHLLLAEERYKTGAVESGKMAVGLGGLEAHLRAAGAAAEAAAAQQQMYNEAFLAVQGDYTRPLAGGDQPLVTPERDVSFTTGGLTPEQVDLLGQYQEAAGRLREEIFNITHEIGTFGVEQEKLNIQLGGATAELGHYEELMAPLQAVVGETTTAHEGLAVNVGAVHQAIYDELVQMGAAPDVITAYAVAVGIMTEEQAAAALQAAAVKVKIEELALQIAQGLPVSTALTQLDTFIAKLEGEGGVVPALGGVPPAALAAKEELLGLGEGVEQAAKTMGVALGVGLREGFKDEQHESTLEARNVAKAVSDATAEELGIPPSSVYRAFGVGTMQGLIMGWTDKEAEAIAFFADLFDGIQVVWESRPWEELPEYSNYTIATGFEELQSQVQPVLQEFIDWLFVWWQVVDWAALGRNIVGGIVAGVNNNAGDLYAALVALAEQALAEAKAALGIASPSDVMAEQVGAPIVDGIIAGIESRAAALDDALEATLQTIEETLDFADAFGDLAQGFEKQFKRQVLDPLEGQLDHMQWALEGHTAALEETVARLWPNFQMPDLLHLPFSEAIGEILSIRATLIHTGAADFEVAQADAVLAAYLERNRLEREYEEQQKRLLQLEEQRAQLAFLQQQLELIKLVKDNDLDVNILAGVELGLQADAGQLMATMTEVMRQLIIAAQDELQIHSPSRPFRAFGQNVMESMAMGVEERTRSLKRSLESGMTTALTPRRMKTGGGQAQGGARGRTIVNGGYHVYVYGNDESALTQLQQQAGGGRGSGKRLQVTA